MENRSATEPICVNRNGETTCYCMNTLEKPNKDGLCPQVRHRVSAKHLANRSHVIHHTKLREIVNLGGGKHFILPDSLSNKSAAASTTGGAHQNMQSPRHQQISPDSITHIQIIIPVAALFFVSMTVIYLIIKRYRVSKLKRRSTGNTDSANLKNGDNVRLIDRMNKVTRNPTYFKQIVGQTGDGDNKGSHLFVIPLQRIRLLDVVGEGAFGQVFKGELLEEPANDVDAAVDARADEVNTEEGYEKRFLTVAVKILKEGVSSEVKDDFEREVEIMSAFDHDNILKLVGIITEEVGETPFMVFEYMAHGDLAELLRKNDPIMRDSDDCVILRKPDLIDIATQIANGMAYLTSQHFVHRDLATRNCLVGEGLVVKISDFGMSRDIYTCDYYKIGGSRLLPVRWMSPESVKYGRFTTESDVWAYGVVLWELFSYGKQPYYGHANEEVVRFLDEGILLQRPNECTSTIYHIMLGCWKTDPKDRFSFKVIHNYLVEYGKQLLRNIHTQSQSLDSTNFNEVIT